MTDFDYDTKGLTDKKTEPESKLEDVEDEYEPSGNGQRRRTRVNAEKDNERPSKQNTLGNRPTIRRRPVSPPPTDFASLSFPRFNHHQRVPFWLISNRDVHSNH